MEANPNIRIAYFNMTKINGPLWFIDAATLKGLGGPAPRNVMIPAIILSIRKNMRIKKGFELRDVCGEKVIVAGSRKVSSGSRVKIQE